MPKQSYELKTFSEGIVSHPDPEDLTINSATHSQNLDPIAPAGTLAPKKTYGLTASFGEPYTTVAIALDQRIGVDVDEPKYTMIFFTPALGANGEITQNARIGFVENWYNRSDNLLEDG
tara:strand:+ start:630 stop:986 length:357 start_codon:yes stop_codon:yes gene_type:complete